MNQTNHPAQANPEISRFKKSEREKNLFALSVLLAGLFLGSLFLDVVQLFIGSGFSGRMAQKYNVLETRGKTWVAYTDPKVTLELITEKDCATCNADEALVWLRRVLPTLEVREVEAGSEAGRALIERFQIASLPAMVFSGNLTKTDFFTQAETLFTEKNGKYHFRMTELGLPAGKYLRQPSISESDILIGNPEAKVKVIEYSDFQCPYCQSFHADLMKALQGKTADVFFVFKNLPLNVFPQSLNAALASECAAEQGKFAAFSDILFARQSEWANTSGTRIFKVYGARAGVSAADFGTCLDSEKYLPKLSAIRAEAEAFGIAGTPATFVNEIFLKGAVPKETIDETLSQELAR